VRLQTHKGWCEMCGSDTVDLTCVSSDRRHTSSYVGGEKGRKIWWESYAFKSINLSIFLNDCDTHTFIWKLIFGGKKTLWKEVNRLLSLHYSTIVYQLHCLATINDTPWFPWPHRLPLLLWMNDGSNCGAHCCTSMGSAVTREWCGYHGYQSLCSHVG
jgi:hypothetical protein